MPDRVGQHQGVAVFAADRDGVFVQRPRSVAPSQIALDLTEGFECPDQIAPLPGLPAQPHGLDQVAMRIGQGWCKEQHSVLRGHVCSPFRKRYAPLAVSGPADNAAIQFALPKRAAHSASVEQTISGFRTRRPTGQTTRG